MKTLCIKAIVSGKVQGVFYRACTVEKAKALKLTGWVRNTADGKVELIACGEEQNVKALVDWLWQGSKASKVDSVSWEEVVAQSFDDFATKH
ncbi:MAG: acylphosphatase [Coxiellaceae bacterium]|nr:acylphosphatase [Coxiellaceae bacterium]